MVIGSGVGSVERTARAGLLEDNAHEVATISLHGFEIATVLAELNVIRQGSESGRRSLAPDAEAAQPLYARYWLHNRGPAPLGGLPTVAHLHPHHVTTTESETLTAAYRSQRLHRRDSVGRLSSWCVRRAGRPCPRRCRSTLEPGAHLEADVAVTMPAGTAPGRYPVRAQLTVAGCRRAHGVAPDRRGRLPDHRRRQQCRGPAPRGGAGGHRARCRGGRATVGDRRYRRRCATSRSRRT